MTYFSLYELVIDSVESNKKANLLDYWHIYFDNDQEQ